MWSGPFTLITYAKIELSTLSYCDEKMISSPNGYCSYGFLCHLVKQTRKKNEGTKIKKRKPDDRACHKMTGRTELRENTFVCLV